MPEKRGEPIRPGQTTEHLLGSSLTASESERIERKESAQDREAIRKTICAFANDLGGTGEPGVIFIGVRDDGSCADLEVTDKLLRQLQDIRGEGNIQPLPSLSVTAQTAGGCRLVVVTVEPASAPPVRFKGRVWVRVGSSVRIATPDEERRLAERRRAFDLPFDLRPLPSATLDDLDLALFERVYLPAAVAPEIIEANRRSRDEQLRALRFLDRDGTPTVLALLVLGVEPRTFVPGAYIQFLRVAGSDLVEPISDQKLIDGPLPDLLRRLDDVLEANVHVATDIRSQELEVQRPDYPLEALRQLTRNAVLHRNYETTHAPVRLYWFEDRIEIHSPGGPFGQVTRENFGEPGVSDYRNPHLAEAMRVLGYVQKFGIGIELARRSLTDNGNPPLEFEVQPNHVLCTVKVRA